MREVTLFVRLVRERGGDVVRLARNYRTRNWKHFTKGVTSLVPADWPLEKPVDRQRALYDVLERTLGPVVASDAHLALIEALSQLLDTLRVADRSAFLALVDRLDAAGHLTRTQGDMLDVVSRFFRLVEEFPGAIRVGPRGPQPRD
jgi:hypothetical protein